jgi:tRNA A58 N-methylase Trm61
VRLADFEIPDDQIENYALALEAGRSVVAYPATAANVAAVEAAFRAGGLVNVKTF